MVIRKL